MAKITKEEMLTAIEEMSVLDLSELVKALEEKFGVTAAAPVAMAAAPAAVSVVLAEALVALDCGLLQAPPR